MPLTCQIQRQDLRAGRALVAEEKEKHAEVTPGHVHA